MERQFPDGETWHQQDWPGSAPRMPGPRGLRLSRLLPKVGLCRRGERGYGQKANPVCTKCFEGCVPCVVQRPGQCRCSHVAAFPAPRGKGLPWPPSTSCSSPAVATLKITPLIHRFLHTVTMGSGAPRAWLRSRCPRPPYRSVQGRTIGAKASTAAAAAGYRPVLLRVVPFPDPGTAADSGTRISRFPSGRTAGAGPARHLRPVRYGPAPHRSVSDPPAGRAFGRGDGRVHVRPVPALQGTRRLRG